MTEIRLEGYDDLLKRITTLAQLKGLAAAVRAAAMHVKGKAATYPGGNAHRAQPFVSAKQRRGFFAKLRKGEIDVPYRRGVSAGSETLGRKWTISTSNNGLTATIGNNVSYGQLVQGPGQQTRYHATTGWKTTDEIADAEREIVVEFLAQEFERLVGGAT